MRKFLALLFGLALFVPLAACGGGDDDESGSDEASSSASGTDEESTTTTTENEDEEEGDEGGDAEGANPDSDYCGVVQDVIESGEAFGENFDFSDEESLEFASDALEELRDSVDDDDAEDDYETVIDGFSVLIQAFAEAGDDPEAQAEVFADPEVSGILEEFSAAGERIDAFTLEECGTTLGGDTEVESTDGTAGGTGSGEDTSLEDFAEDVADCEGGDMGACDTLYAETPFGSEAEAVALECGGEDPGGNHTGDCEDAFG